MAAGCPQRTEQQHSSGAVSSPVRAVIFSAKNLHKQATAGHRPPGAAGYLPLHFDLALKFIGDELRIEVEHLPACGTVQRYAIVHFWLTIQ